MRVEGTDRKDRMESVDKGSQRGGDTRARVLLEGRRRRGGRGMRADAGGGESGGGEAAGGEMVGRGAVARGRRHRQRGGVSRESGRGSAPMRVSARFRARASTTNRVGSRQKKIAS